MSLRVREFSQQSYLASREKKPVANTLNGLTTKRYYRKGEKMRFLIVSLVCLPLLVNACSLGVSEKKDVKISTESASQSAEDVMDVYVEAYRNTNFEALIPYVTGTARVAIERNMHFLNGGFQEDYMKLVENFIPEGMSEEMANGAIQILDEIVNGPLMQEMLRSMYNQVEVVSSQHVGDEFHFQFNRLLPKIDMPDLSDLPEIPGMEIPEISELPEMPESYDTTVKMRKEAGVWVIYDIEYLHLR